MSQKQRVRIFLDSNVLTAGIVSAWGLDKAILSLCAARICRLVLAEADHIARHGVTPGEAEEVIRGNPIVLNVQFRNREQRILSAGRTAKGRALAKAVSAWLRHFPPSEA